MNRLAQLSWKILEAKYAYYILQNPIMEDFEFDELALEYDDLCDLFGDEPTATKMVGFDPRRPCCQLVMRKMGRKNQL